MIGKFFVFGKMGAKRIIELLFWVGGALVSLIVSITRIHKGRKAHE